MAFFDTTDLIHGIEHYLRTLLIPDGPQEGEPLFQVVTKLDTPNLGLAVQRVIGVTERIACVVPGQDDYRTLAEKKPFITERWQEIIIILSATDFQPFTKTAFFGDEYTEVNGFQDSVSTQNGLLNMKDHLIEKMMGQPLKNFSRDYENSLGQAETFNLNFPGVFYPENAVSARFTEREQPDGDYALSDIREGIITTWWVNVGREQNCTTRGTPLRRR